MLSTLGSTSRIAVGGDWRRRTPRVRALPSLRGAQHVERAVDVDLVRRHGIVDRARHRGDRGFVEDHGGAADERRDLLVVADVGALEIDARANFLQVALAAGEQIIDDDDLRLRPSASRRRTMAEPMKPGPSGDDVVAHD